MTTNDYIIAGFAPPKHNAQYATKQNTYYKEAKLWQA